MNPQLSVVIICRNGARTIGAVLDAALALSDDVVVYDSGSTDGTQALVTGKGARLVEGDWPGYGPAKRRATGLAKRDWILSLDADEAPDAALVAALNRLSLEGDGAVYRFWFRTYLGSTPLKWGEWGTDRHIRLFHRRLVQWDEAPVHEELIIPKGTRVVDVPGYVRHYTVADLAAYSDKVRRYALLNAEKKFAKGQRASSAKALLAPLFTFLKFYVFRLGFLDGWAGWVVARMTAYYTFLKYARLRELSQESGAGGPEPI